MGRLKVIGGLNSSPQIRLAIFIRLLTKTCPLGSILAKQFGLTPPTISSSIECLFRKSALSSVTFHRFFANFFSPEKGVWGPDFCTVIARQSSRAVSVGIGQTLVQKRLPIGHHQCQFTLSGIEFERANTANGHTDIHQNLAVLVVAKNPQT